jgi:hypothetical protein
MSEAGSDAPIPIGPVGPVQSNDFTVVYKDWQAIRIIRDNYFEGWKLFYTFYCWFAAVMFGVGGYLVLNRPFHGRDATIVGLIGASALVIVLCFAIIHYFRSLHFIRNVRLILERTNDAEFLADKVLSNRGNIILLAGAGIGLTLGLGTWIYVVFFYYSGLK